MYSAASESMLELLMTVPNSAHYLNLDLSDSRGRSNDERSAHAHNDNYTNVNHKKELRDT